MAKGLPLQGGPFCFTRQRSYCLALVLLERLPNLRPEPPINPSTCLPCQRTRAAGDLGGTGHAFAQRAVRIRENRDDGEVVGEFLAQAFELLRLRNRPIRGRRGEHLSHAAGVCAVRVRQYLQLHACTGRYLFEFPVTHQDACLHCAAVHDFAELVPGRKVFRGLLLDKGCRHDSGEWRPNIQRVKLALGDRPLCLDPLLVLKCASNLSGI